MYLYFSLRLLQSFSASFAKKNSSFHKNLVGTYWLSWSKNKCNMDSRREKTWAQHNDTLLCHNLQYKIVKITMWDIVENRMKFPNGHCVRHNFSHLCLVQYPFGFHNFSQWISCTQHNNERPPTLCLVQLWVVLPTIQGKFVETFQKYKNNIYVLTKNAASQEHKPNRNNFRANLSNKRSAVNYIGMFQFIWKWMRILNVGTHQKINLVNRFWPFSVFQILLGSLQVISGVSPWLSGISRKSTAVGRGHIIS